MFKNTDIIFCFYSSRAQSETHNPHNSIYLQQREGWPLFHTVIWHDLGESQIHRFVNSARKIKRETRHSNLTYLCRLCNVVWKHDFKHGCWDQWQGNTTTTLWTLCQGICGSYCVTTVKDSRHCLNRNSVSNVPKLYSLSLNNPS